MTRWNPIETAPKDGTHIQACIHGCGCGYVIAWIGGLLDSSGEDCGAWRIADEQDPPDCWTDGICWAFNDQGVASAPPTNWKPLRESLQ